MKNHQASWYSCKQLKISKCSISLARLGQCSKSKVTPLNSSGNSNDNIRMNRNIVIIMIIIIIIIIIKSFFDINDSDKSYE